MARLRQHGQPFGESRTLEHGKSWSENTSKRGYGLFLRTVAILIVLFLADHYRRMLQWATTPVQKTQRDRVLKDFLQKPRMFSDWREMAEELAMLTPDETLRRLKTEDPFGTRAFFQKLEDFPEETTLPLSKLQELFPCPRDRISIPDQRRHERSEQYRKATPGVFLYFQHLRKAGGTNFCSLAQANLPKKAIPSYYCMPDYQWPIQSGQHKCAGCLKQWSNQQITSLIGDHRVAGNEWDPFVVKKHFDLNAAYVTSFRKPVDRALSQFRFECTEHRGCHETNITKWWETRRDLHNVYTWTFSEERMHRISEEPKYAKDRAKAIGTALDTISKFHLVLSKELLRYGDTAVKAVLGFQDTSALTTFVRPHNTVNRKDSWKPSDQLSPADLKRFEELLALDEILTDAAQRFFLERLVCETS